MKKANRVLLLIFASFLCLTIGIFIGRFTASNNIYISTSKNQQTHTLTAKATNPTQSDELGKININTASVSLLQSLPNIGETLAQRIVDYREENGKFTDIEDLLSVNGIGEKRFDEIKQYITVGG